MFIIQYSITHSKASVLVYYGLRVLAITHRSIPRQSSPQNSLGHILLQSLICPCDYWRSVEPVVLVVAVLVHSAVLQHPEAAY